ncbi:MAG: hypothetical protein IJN50_00595 [Clostridia bacterium]|nr:hypothetical protein [Clostridia bacterium]
MINEANEILKLYLENLDREYDNDMVLLTEKILADLDSVKKDIKTLISVIPNDISDEVKERMKELIK